MLSTNTKSTISQNYARLQRDAETNGNLSKKKRTACPPTPPPA